MKSPAISNTGRVDWVNIFSLLVIALTLVAVIRNFTGDKKIEPAAVTSVEVHKASPELSAVVEQKPAETSRGESAEQTQVADNIAAEALETVSVDLPGIKMTLRELRAPSDGAQAGEIRNMEFFIREGIRPRALFDGSSQLVTGYWPLFHNNVGYGASTVRILYQLVEADSDGDGQLTRADRKSLAFSLPDGSHYRVLDRDVSDIADMTYLSEIAELQLEYSQGGEVQRRVYSLATGSG